MKVGHSSENYNSLSIHVVLLFWKVCWWLKHLLMCRALVWCKESILVLESNKTFQTIQDILRNNEKIFFSKYGNDYQLKTSWMRLKLICRFWIKTQFELRPMNLNNIWFFSRQNKSLRENLDEECKNKVMDGSSGVWKVGKGGSKVRKVTAVIKRICEQL